MSGSHGNNKNDTQCARCEAVYPWASIHNCQYAGVALAKLVRAMEERITKLERAVKAKPKRERRSPVQQAREGEGEKRG